MRITLIHALKHSIVPIEASFARLWPDATLMNLVDDSLSADLARDGQPHQRDDRSVPGAWTLRGLDRRRRDPLHLLGLRPLHRGGGARARADAGAQAQRSDDRAGRREGPPDRPALDVSADPGVDAAGISPRARDRAETRGGRHGGARSRRPRRTRSPGRGGLARSARLRPDRARAIQHGARRGAGRGSLRPAGADDAGQRGREAEDNCSAAEIARALRTTTPARHRAPPAPACAGSPSSQASAPRPRAAPP